MPEYEPPENVHGPGIRKAIRPLAEAIQKESGASKVIIICAYELNGKGEKMNIRMQVSKDNVMERVDALPPKPKKDALAVIAEEAIRAILEAKPDDQGGK